jgi:hypothetical protein
MASIIVGNAGGQCILELTHVPEVGETITVEKTMIKWRLTSPDHLLPRPGKTYKVTNKKDDFDTGAGFLGVLPWFMLEEIPQR